MRSCWLKWTRGIATSQHEVWVCERLAENTDGKKDFSGEYVWTGGRAVLNRAGACVERRLGRGVLTMVVHWW